MLIRNSTSLDVFTYHIKKLFKKDQPPSIFSFGPRKISMIHCQIRNNCSRLKGDMYSNFISDSPICQCGNEIENSNHYFFHCPLYNNTRQKMLRSLHFVPPGELNTETFLKGSNALDGNHNQRLFKIIFIYIKESQRFQSD